MIDPFRGIKRFGRKLLSGNQEILLELGVLRVDLEKARLALGRLERELASSSPSDFPREFQTFSQFGEDGIISWILGRVPIARRFFVEFGVEDYRESNTRFLLMSGGGWSGLVMDGSKENLDQLRGRPEFWRNHLHAAAAFITRENINQLLTDYDAAGDIGLLSIDVDGNDYWIWDAIEVCSPRIVICEYNALWGAERSVAVPYKPDFNLFDAHFSGLYWGASLRALTRLGRKKGYRLVAVNGAGHNVFFVRNDIASGLPELAPESAWRPPQFRTSRNKEGQLTFLSWVEAAEQIADMPVENV